MKISILIPAFNEEKLIESTLAAIRGALPAFAERGWETEVIVCDNNSTDRTAELARAAGASVVFEPVNQIGRARNRAAEAASGDWLVFVDADSQPGRGLFADTADAIASGKYLYGGTTVRLQSSHATARGITAFWNVISRVGKMLAGSYIFCEVTAFREVGGFDDRYYAAEELILTQKLKRFARGRGKRSVILHRHPLLTSDRKVRLYSGRELLSFFLRAGLLPRRVLTSREACGPWYDGRR